MVAKVGKEKKKNYTVHYQNEKKKQELN